MSPIMELIKASEPQDGYVRSLDFKQAAIKAIPDLQRLVKWVKAEAVHLYGCGIRPGSPDYCKALNAKEEPKCTCGLSEIQSLLGE